MKARNKNHTKGLVLALLIVGGTALVISPAFAYWTVTNQNDYQGQDSLSNSDFDNDQFYEVNVYRAFYEVDNIESTTSETTISDVSGWEAFEDLITFYSIQGLVRTDVINGSGTSSTYTNTYTYAASGNTYYSSIQIMEGVYTCELQITDDIVYTYAYTHHTLAKDTISETYKGTYSLKINSATLGEASPEEDYFGILEVNQGDIISSKTFSTFFKSMQEDYYFSNFIYSVNHIDDDNSETTTSVNPFYLNITPVTSDLDLYVLFYKNEPSSLGLSALTDAVNNNTGTLKVSNSGTTSYDLNGDIGYDSETQSVTLGYYDRKTVVQSGSTVNFCLTDGSIITTCDYSSSDRTSYINEHYTGSSSTTYNKKCDYTIKLTGDLEINGEVTLAAELGSGSNVGVQGNIHTHYVTLDLCGHVIEINDGGSLLGYGVITDSIGNGEIRVNGGGVIETPIVAYDYKGGSSTVGSFAFDVFPFSNYNIPYLQVPTYLEYDRNGWGQLDTFYVINPFSSYVLEIDGSFSVLGAGINENSLFKLTNGTIGDSYVLIAPTPNNNVLNDSLANSYTSSQALERHVNFYLNNADAILDNFTLTFDVSYIIGTITIDMNSDQFDFPISSFFNLYFYNSNLTVSTRIVFQKGSSLYMDSNSNLILSTRTINRVHINSLATHTESVTLAGAVFFLDVDVDSYISGQNSMISSDRHNINAVSTIETYFSSNVAFWKYNASAYKIGGSILFEEGNTASNPYSFGGYLDLGSVGIISTDGEIKTTYTLRTTDSNNYNPFSNLLYEIENNNFDVYFKSYDYDGVNGQYYCGTLAYSADNCDDYMALLRGRALPLISNGIAYSYSNVESDSPNIVGTYNKDLDLIDSDGYLYYFNTGDGDQKPYLGSSNTTNSKRNREYNHDSTLRACDYDYNNHYIIDSETENTYALFSGLYLPYNTEDKTVNLQRLISNKDVNGDSVTLNLSVSYSSTYSRWVR